MVLLPPEPPPRRLLNRLGGSTGSLPDDLQMIPHLRCSVEVLEAAVREVPFQPGIPDTSTLFHEWYTAMDSIIFPGQPPQNEYMNFSDRALPHVAACLYHRISDLSFLRKAGAQLHAAGDIFFLLLALLTGQAPTLSGFSPPPPHNGRFAPLVPPGSVLGQEGKRLTSSGG